MENTEIRRMRRNVEINELFLIFGVVSIIAFFLLIFTIGGPYITTYSSTERYEGGGSGTTFMSPIWIFLLYIGSGALLLGFLLKFLSVIITPIQQLDVLVYVGLTLTTANMFLQIYHAIQSFTAIYIASLYIPGPIILFLALLMSVAYLVAHWLKKRVHSQIIL